MNEDLKYMQAAISEAKNRVWTGVVFPSVLCLCGTGHNRRIQDDDPLMHAEIDCIRNAGRIGRYGNAVLYSTLTPCYLCAGAVVQFGIPRVVVGESSNFAGAEDFLRDKGVEVVNLSPPEVARMMVDYIGCHPDVWNEDIGTL